jgi:hypothetical protein
MRSLFILLLFLSQSIIILAQNEPVQKADMQNYFLLKSFLSQYKINPVVFPASIKPQWNSNLYQKQFEQWFTMARKKEQVEAILVDSRHMIQPMPINYFIKDLIWVSPAKRYSYRDSPEYINASFGEQIEHDIINDFGSGLINSAISKRKYHYRYSAVDNKPYQIPSFLKF